MADSGKKKLLITGASGFLGWHLCYLAVTRWQVFATGWQHQVVAPGVRICHIDLTQQQEVQSLFSQIGPDAVIHAAAQSNPNYCQTHCQQSYHINVVATATIGELCAADDIPLFFTSSDLIFGGDQAPYREEDPPAPVNIYGEHKALAEAKLRQCYPSVAICRMPLMFGSVAGAAASYLQSLLQALRQRQPLHLFVDEYRTPVSATTAAVGILSLLAQGFQGTIHLGGSQRISRYDFGLLVARIFDYSTENIHPCQQRQVKMAAPRPGDVSLDSSKAFACGYRPESLERQLQQGCNPIISDI